MQYALSAMASGSQYAARPFDKFVLIMEPNSRQFETEKVEDQDVAERGQQFVLGFCLCFDRGACEPGGNILKNIKKY